MNKCVICGKNFIPVTGGQKTCSIECRKEYQKIYARNWRDNLIGNRIKKCVVCDKEFESRYGRITCSKECSEERKRQVNREWQKRTYKPKTRICLICGKEFSGRSPYAKTCSPECSKELKRRYNSEYEKRRG